MKQGPKSAQNFEVQRATCLRAGPVVLFFLSHHLILLRRVGDSQLMLNTGKCTKNFKSIWGVFSLIIRPDHLHFVVDFQSRFCTSKNPSNFWFLLPKINSTHHVVINKHDKIVAPFKDKVLMAQNICMNQLYLLRCCPCWDF